MAEHVTGYYTDFVITRVITVLLIDCQHPEMENNYEE